MTALPLNIELLSGELHMEFDWPDHWPRGVVLDDRIATVNLREGRGRVRIEWSHEPEGWVMVLLDCYYRHPGPYYIVEPGDHPVADWARLFVPFRLEVPGVPA